MVRMQRIHRYPRVRNQVAGLLLCWTLFGTSLLLPAAVDNEDLDAELEELLSELTEDVDEAGSRLEGKVDRVGQELRAEMRRQERIQRERRQAILLQDLQRSAALGIRIAEETSDFELPEELRQTGLFSGKVRFELMLTVESAFGSSPAVQTVSPGTKITYQLTELGAILTKRSDGRVFPLSDSFTKQAIGDSLVIIRYTTSQSGVRFSQEIRLMIAEKSGSNVSGRFTSQGQQVSAQGRFATTSSGTFTMTDLGAERDKNELGAFPDEPAPAIMRPMGEMPVVVMDSVSEKIVVENGPAEVSIKGDLPPGLTLRDGEITGYPEETEKTEWKVTIVAENENGVDREEVTIVVAPNLWMEYGNALRRQREELSEISKRYRELTNVAIDNDPGRISVEQNTLYPPPNNWQVVLEPKLRVAARENYELASTFLDLVNLPSAFVTYTGLLAAKKFAKLFGTIAKDQMQSLATGAIPDLLEALVQYSEPILATTGSSPFRSEGLSHQVAFDKGLALQNDWSQLRETRLELGKALQRYIADYEQVRKDFVQAVYATDELTEYQKQRVRDRLLLPSPFAFDLVELPPREEPWALFIPMARRLSGSLDFLSGKDPLTNFLGQSGENWKEQITGTESEPWREKQEAEADFQRYRDVVSLAKALVPGADPDLIRKLNTPLFSPPPTGQTDGEN